MKSKFVIILLSSFIAKGACAVDGSLTLSTGFDFSSGKYGTANTTNILSIPVIGKCETGHWLFKLTVPYLWISGSSGVVPGIGPMATTTTKTTTSRYGLGDMIAAVTYNVYEGSGSKSAIDLTGKIKLATADAGLGSGQDDYAAQVDVYQSLGKFTAMGSLGYKILGSPPGIAMQGAAYGYLGGAYQFTAQTSGGAEMDLSQSPSATTGEQRELMVYVSHKIDKKLKIQGYVLKGFANGSPDRGIGALVSAKF